MDDGDFCDPDQDQAASDDWGTTTDPLGKEANMDDAQRREALLLKGNGVSTAEIARQLRVPRSTVQGFLSEHEKSKRPSLAEIPPSKGPSKSDVDQMELAARKVYRLPVEGYDQDPFPAQDVWDKWEVENSKRIERALSQTKFKVTLPDEPCAICFVSDQHISGGNTVDLKKMREDAQFIAAQPNVYAVLGGDGVDQHIKHVSAIISARSTPDDQWKLYDYYLQILAEKIAVVLSGNHCHWSLQVAGVDILRRLAEKNKIRYSPHAAFVEFFVGSQCYRVCVAHQYRFNSSMNPTHSPKQMLNFGEHDFDIGCVCHHHEPAQESFRRRGLTRWVCRPGAYQVYSDYSAQYGYGNTSPTCPTAVVFPGQRKIVGFDTVQDAVAYMRGLRR